MAWWWSALVAEAMATLAVVVAGPEALPMAWWWSALAAAAVAAPAVVVAGPEALPMAWWCSWTGPWYAVRVRELEGLSLGLAELHAQPLLGLLRRLGAQSRGLQLHPQQRHLPLQFGVYAGPGEHGPARPAGNRKARGGGNANRNQANHDGQRNVCSCAMEEWVLRPPDSNNSTALDDILPCADAAATSEALRRSKEVNHQLVATLNDVLANVSNANAFPPGSGPPLNYNQSGPPVPLLCSPYRADLSDRPCAAGEVPAALAPQAWRGHVCQVEGAPGPETCATPGRLTPSMYAQALAVANASAWLVGADPSAGKNGMDSRCEWNANEKNRIRDDGQESRQEYYFTGLGPRSSIF
ncbi:hypothetical protein VPH35_049778 [Triticum aestivum]